MSLGEFRKRKGMSSMLHSDGFVPRFHSQDTTMTIRVLIVDDDTSVRQVVTGILSPHEDIEVVGEATTGDEAVSSVERLQPDLVIMDIRMPRMDGIAAAREIRRRFPHVKVIGL